MKRNPSLNNTRRLAGILIVFLTATFCSAQERTLKTENLTYFFQLEDAESSIKVHNDRMYHWYDAGKLKSSQGDYHGRLLRGEYRVLDREGNLITKGIFKDGLQQGFWKTWSPDGFLIEEKQFKNGQLHGKLRRFENGKLVLEQHYRKGLEHGRKTTFQKDGTHTRTKYRKGELVEVEVKVEKIKETKDKENKKNEEPSSDELKKKRKKKDKHEEREKKSS